jgi:hypothetical protein
MSRYLPIAALAAVVLTLFAVAGLFAAPVASSTVALSNGDCCDCCGDDCALCCGDNCAECCAFGACVLCCGDACELCCGDACDNCWSDAAVAATASCGSNSGCCTTR